MNLNKNIIKHYSYVMMVMVVIVALVSVNPLSYIGYDNASPVGESKGFIATSTAIGVTAATVAGSFVAGYSYNEFFSEANPQAGTNATDEDGSINETYVRQETQLDAIRSEGSNELFNEQFDNDLITIEGQVEQRINQRYVKLQADNKTNNITTETKAVTEAADATRKYLKTGMNNYVETHNFGVKALAGYQEDLEVANSSDLMITGEKAKVSNATEFNSATNTEGAIVILENDLDGENNSLYYGNDTVIIGNGNKINGIVRNKGRGQNATFVDINITDTLYIGSGYVNLIDVETPTLNFYSSGANGYKDYQGYYNKSAEIGTVIDSYTEYDEKNQNALESVTFNSSEIANISNSYNNASEIPKVKFPINNSSNVTLPAINVSLDTSYYTKGGVNVAVPYKLSTGEPINKTETVIIQTPNTGIQNYAEPVNFVESFNIINKRDDLSNQTYVIAEQFARDVWNDYMEEVVNDPNRTIFTDGVDPSLASLQFSAPTTPKGTVSSYTGVFEGTTKPWTDRIKFRNTTNNKTVTGALFTDDIKALTNQTSDSNVITDGDVMNMSKAGKAFVLNQNNGEKTELKGEWEVVDVLNQDNAKVRDYEQNTNNVSKNVERLEDQREAIDITIEGGGQGISLPSFGGNKTIYILVAIIGAVVLLRD